MRNPCAIRNAPIRSRFVRLALALGAALSLFSRPAAALTPDDPAVQAAVTKAKGYLELNTPFGVGVGHQALVALALVKTGADARHPVVKQAVSGIKNALASNQMAVSYLSVYNISVAIIFLKNLDPKAHESELKSLVSLLLRFQRGSGGFSSDRGGDGDADIGDNSMTQFAIMAMWEAEQAGINMPPAAWQRVAAWQVGTQMPDGGFRYRPSQGELPTLTMTAAGAASLYICAAHYGLGKAAANKPNDTDNQAENGPTQPSALQPVGEKKDDDEKPRAAQGNIPNLRGAIDRANAWLSANYTVNSPDWTYYYLYTLERYYSFRELVENDADPEPQWYTDGARFLLKTQANTGTWDETSGVGPATAFGVLFLVRSTKRGLEKTAAPLAAGSLIAGHGLPDAKAELKLHRGQVVVKPLSGPAEKLMEILENPDHPKFNEAVEGFGELLVEADEAQLSPHLVRLKKLAASDSPEARIAAVTALGRLRTLDHVPTLIYALGDDDAGVVRAADQALRFVSRKLDGVGITPETDKVERDKAVSRWRAWYLSVRPDYEFQPE
jgi:hypothetical protein